MVTQKTSVLKKSNSSSRDPTLLAALSHFSILAVLLIGPFSMVIPLLIWLSERNRTEPSLFIEFHAKQAFFYQVAVYLISAILGILSLVLSIIFIGFLLIPVLILFALAAIIYGIYGGMRISQGEDFRYIYVADFIEA